MTSSDWQQLQNPEANDLNPCLLIKTGDFNTKGGPDWISPWMVMTRL